MMPYLLHASVLLTGCFLFYWILIRKETFFQLNRWLLLGSILLSVLLPLFTIPSNWSLRAQNTPSTFESPYTISHPVLESTKQDILKANTFEEDQTANFTLPPPQESVSFENTPHAESFWTISLSSALWYMYWIGVAVFSIAFLIQLMILLVKKYALVSHRDGKFRIVELVRDEAPYSFWNTIFINPTKYDNETYNQIIEHEKIHIEQVHFLDKLIGEFLLIAFWFNPFVWMIRRAIANNLEYLTDSSMLRKGTERKSYQLSLLRVSVPQFALHLTTNYNHSFLKSRIAMMNTKKSSARSSWKYMFLLPLLMFSMLCLNEVQSKQSEYLGSDDQFQTVLSLEEGNEVNEIEMFESAESMEETESEDKHSSPPANGNFLIANENTFLLEGSVEELEEQEEWNEWTNDLDPGAWSGRIDGERVCIKFNNSKEEKNWTWITSECFLKTELSRLPTGQDADFTIKRTAGSLKLNGSFQGSYDGDTGEGTFEFEPSAGFSAFLKSQGMNLSKERDMLHLFFNNVDEAYVNTLKSSGIKANGKDLVQLSVHGIDQEKVQEFVQVFNELNYKGYTVKDLIQFEIHDVDAEYVNDIRAEGLTDLTVPEIVQARIHDVEPQFIKAVQDYGFEDVDLRDIIQFSIHDVDVDYINELKNLGYRDLSIKDIVQASIHDVEPDYISALAEAGFEDMSMKELVQFSIHDIDAEFIKAFQESGFTDLEHQDIIQAGIHDVSPSYVRALRDYGMTDLDMEEIVQMAIHDVDADYLNQMRKLGFRDLDNEEIVQARIHDVSPKYIQDLKENGLGDMDMDEIVQFRIHDVKARDIKAFRAAGFDVDSEEIVQASIHNVSANYIEEMRALGFKDAELEDFIQAKIHDVTPSFVERMREKGHNPEDLEDYVKLKIGGM